MLTDQEEGWKPWHGLYMHVERSEPQEGVEMPSMNSIYIPSNQALVSTAEMPHECPLALSSKQAIPHSRVGVEGICLISQITIPPLYMLVLACTIFSPQIYVS
jgi:hypothetical protein